MENLEEDTQESNVTTMAATNAPLDLTTTTTSTTIALIPPVMEDFSSSGVLENVDDSVILIQPRIDMVDLTISPTQQTQQPSASASAGAGSSSIISSSSSIGSTLLGPLTFEEPSCSKDALKDSNCLTASSSTSLSTNENPNSSTSSGSAVASSTDGGAAASVAPAATTTTTTAAAAVTNILECPICLQTCIHPARLPCGHIFCFLCVKGVAYKNRRCAMCRREIPPEFLDHPQLVNGIEDICTTKATDDGYQWFYEGRNGWWQYDDRTSQDLEEAFKKGERSCTILVAGYVYIVDFDAMIQQRQNEPARCRRVKRDLATIPKKGVAGLRIEGNTVTTDSNFAQQVYQSRQSRYHSVDNDDLDSPDNSLMRGHAMDSANPQGPLRLSYGLGGYVIELGNPSEFVSTSAATDAALRIASDIIGSTLAHADELTRSSSNILPSNNTSSSYQQQQQSILNSDISLQNPATGELNLNDLALNSQLQQHAAAATPDDAAAVVGNNNTSLNNTNINTNTTTTSNSAATSTAAGTHLSSLMGTPITSSHTVVSLPRERGSRELLGAAEDLLGATQRVIASADQPTIDLFEQTLNDFHALTLLRNIDDDDGHHQHHQQQAQRIQQQQQTASPPNGQRSQHAQNPLQSPQSQSQNPHHYHHHQHHNHQNHHHQHPHQHHHQDDDNPQ